MNRSRRPRPRPLRLLSLDGGGIRGYSALLILDELMRRVQLKQKLKHLPKPCEYFDLIGGTSTGGIIAICLGRLKLSTEECLDIYEEMSEKVFEKPNQVTLWGLLRSRFDADKMTGIIKSVLERTNTVGCNSEAGMIEPSEEGEKPNEEHICHVFVTASVKTKAAMNEPRLLKTYVQRASSAPSNPADANCKIWQAIRATSAAPTFFDPITIAAQDDEGREGDLEEYVDGGFGCNNPCEKVYSEGETFLDEERGQRIQCVVSIGTGVPEVMAYQDSNSFSYSPTSTLQAETEAMIRVVTECDTIHQRMLEKFRKRLIQGKYFRFNVRQGLQGVSMWQYEKLDDVRSHTLTYLERYAKPGSTINDYTQDMDRLVELLVDDDGDLFF